jgi:hypothetical protein
MEPPATGAKFSRRVANTLLKAANQPLIRNRPRYANRERTKSSETTRRKHQASGPGEAATMERRNKRFLVRLFFFFAGCAALEAQMDPNFTAINYPVPRDSLMVMPLLDYQSARSTNDFFTGMSMVEYGLSPRWTAGFMKEGKNLWYA